MDARATLTGVAAGLLALLMVGWPPGAIGSPDQGNSTATPGQGTTTPEPGNQTATADGGNATGSGEAGNASKGIRYDFDHVEATYAAAFQVRAGDDVDNASWALALAGPGRVLNVTYGVVRFWSGNDSSQAGGEGFVKLEGPNGTRRFISNSATYSYYDGGARRTAGTEFSSHKRIENNTLVKDFTPPVFSVHLWRLFAEDGNRTSLFLTTWTGWEAQDQFWKGPPVAQLWREVPGTFVSAGAATDWGDA